MKQVNERMERLAESVATYLHIRMNEEEQMTVVMVMSTAFTIASAHNRKDIEAVDVNLMMDLIAGAKNTIDAVYRMGYARGIKSVKLPTENEG